MIHILVTEIFKFLNGLSPTIMGEISEKEEYPGSFENRTLLISKRNSTVKYGIDSIVFKVPQIWEMLLTGIDKKLRITESSIIKFGDVSCPCKTVVHSQYHFYCRQWHLDWIVFTRNSTRRKTKNK